MTASIKPKHQRMVLIVLALVALVTAALVAMWALRNQASYFYLPSEIAAHPPAPDRGVRLGGMVEKGSIKTLPNGLTIDFLVGDGKTNVPVQFTGIVPALFEAGSGVVAEGHMQPDGTFVATKILAKHDAKYVPREMAGLTPDQMRKKAEKTLQ